MLRSAITKFVYGGVSPAIADVMSTSSDDFTTFYVEVSVLYGSLVNTLGEPLRPTMNAPVKLPVLPPDVHTKIKVECRRDGLRFADFYYIGRHESYDEDGNYLGAKLLFALPQVADSDSGTFVAHWSMTGSITNNIGNDYVEIQQQAGGDSASFTT
jgi:hypothetical protein